MSENLRFPIHSTLYLHHVQIRIPVWVFIRERKLIFCYSPIATLLKKAVTVRGHGRSIKNKGSQSLLLCELLKRRIKLSKNALFPAIRSDKALLKNRITVSFIHQRQGANELITLNGQPELATILFIAGGYVQQIRLFLKRKINLCLVVLDVQN